MDIDADLLTSRDRPRKSLRTRRGWSTCEMPEVVRCAEMLRAWCNTAATIFIVTAVFAR
ncbi:hypothetical protein [Bradyrhizobium sp. CCBAU 25360]|uniref:hypothetical protein n=1 Tax=Bradyrhizobium sp. CCBAU 25360 TaxID=858425 RepID=UPI002304F3F7|nr:hypothetical protein [Bradyrhizobium sp. CCBAU 25360]